MAYALAITLRCRAQDADTFRRVLAEIAPASRAEPGNLAFNVHQSVDEDYLFLVYESYVDEAAYQAHLATPAFERVEKELFPLLVDRDVRSYASLED